MSELRQRKSTNPLEPFRELDAFKMNKLPEEIEQKSSIGKYTKTFCYFISSSVFRYRWNHFAIIENTNCLCNL